MIIVSHYSQRIKKRLSFFDLLYYTLPILYSISLLTKSLSLPYLSLESSMKAFVILVSHVSR